MCALVGIFTGRELYNNWNSTTALFLFTKITLGCVICRTAISTLGDRAFPVVAWNPLPSTLRTVLTLISFRRLFKTELSNISPPLIVSSVSSFYQLSIWAFWLLFLYGALVTRNSLPPHVRSCTTLTTFRKHLKSHLFQSSFPTAWRPIPAPQIRFRPWRYINLFIYLLTYLLTCIVYTLTAPRYTALVTFMGFISL